MSKLVRIQDWLSEVEASPLLEGRLLLTKTEVRRHAAFKSASEEEVQSIISTLHSLALVAYEAYCKEEAADSLKMQKAA